MDSKEAVYRAIELRAPARVPLIYCNRDFESSDVLGAGSKAARGFRPARPNATEWGYRWEKLDGTMGQPHELPLADWDAFKSYVPPDPHASGRLDHLPAWLEKNRTKFLRFGLGISGFNQVTFLRGFENFLIDLYDHPERAAALLDLVFGFENALVGQIAHLPFDAVGFADDWGTQNGLMISPKLWREVFKPRYAQQFAAIHRAGKKVWFHSCGNIHAIIGDLIEAGVDVLELLQPDVFGVEKLSKEFGGKVCFCCSVDHQRRAISGTREEIFAYTRNLNENLGRFGGGFIGYVEDYACLGMSEANYQAIREAFHSLKPVPAATH